MRTRALLVVAGGLLAGPGLLRADEKRPDAEALQGTWRVVSQQHAGWATARPRNMRWVIRGDAIWLVVERAADRAPEGKSRPPGTKGRAGKAGKEGAPPGGLRMSFRLDPATSPKRIDIDGLGKTISYGVYRLEGDRLTVCMGVIHPSPRYHKEAKARGGDEGTRPKAINPELGTVVVLKRVRD